MELRIPLVDGIAAVKESQGAKDFKRQAAAIDDMLAKLKKNDPLERP